MEAADWLVDFGPGAGELGGRDRVRRARRPQVMADPASPHRRLPVRAAPRSRCPAAAPPGGKARIVVAGATENNLKDVTVDFPLGLLRRGHRRLRRGQVHAGERASSTRRSPALLYGTREVPGQAPGASTGIEQLDKVIDIDQQPIGRTPRSNPATYTKVFDPIREVFAQTPEARALRLPARAASAST